MLELESKGIIVWFPVFCKERSVMLTKWNMYKLYGQNTTILSHRVVHRLYRVSLSLEAPNYCL